MVCAYQHSVHLVRWTCTFLWGRSYAPCMPFHNDDDDDDCFSIALFSALSSRLTSLACDYTWVISFLKRVFEYPPKWRAYSASAQVLCTPYNHAPCHFMQSHMRKVYACLAVTCHLRFWQNDQGLLRATAVTRGWNGYRNKSQHRKKDLKQNPTHSRRLW